MIFIVDWGTVTVSMIGPIAVEDLKIAVAESHLWLCKRTTWFRLFFIRIIPTERKYLLANKDAQQGLEISKENFEQYKPIAELNQAVIDGRISGGEYARRKKKMKI